MRFPLQFTVQLPFKGSLLIRISENKTEGSLNKEDCKSWVTGFGSLQLHQGMLNGGLTVICLYYIVCSQANVVCGYTND